MHVPPFLYALTCPWTQGLFLRACVIMSNAAMIRAVQLSPADPDFIPLGCIPKSAMGVS